MELTSLKLQLENPLIQLLSLPLQQHLLQPQQLPLLLKVSKLHKPMLMASTITDNRVTATMASSIMLPMGNNMVNNTDSNSRHKEVLLDIINNSSRTGRIKTKLTASSKLSMGRLKLNKHRQVTAKINRSKAITDKIRANKIIPLKVHMGKIHRSKDIKINSSRVTITNKEIMDKGDMASKEIIIKTKGKAETIILVQINRKEMATTMDKVNKTNGQARKVAMTMVQADNSEENKITEIRIQEAVIMAAIVMVAITTMATLEVAVEEGLKAAEVVVSTEVAEAVEEETSVGDEEASIATMITTTNTVVAAVE